LKLSIFLKTKTISLLLLGNMLTQPSLLLQPRVAVTVQRHENEKHKVMDKYCKKEKRMSKLKANGLSHPPLLIRKK